MHKIIEDGVSSVEMILFEKSGKVNVKFDASNSEIAADKLHFTNSIVNLISNAIKYSTEVPEIEITTKNVDDKILIKVRDNGIGIAQKYQKYIFDKYYRVPTGDIHNTKGFGIGLAYVKRVITAHNGNIEVESELNKGTTFKIWLPLFT